MNITDDATADARRKVRYQSHKSTQNIIRMKDMMQMSDPAVLKVIEERNRLREIARLDRIERHKEIMIENRKMQIMAM